MSYRFFRIPIGGDAQFEQDLNGFLRSHRVVSMERQFVDQGLNSCWCFCVGYEEGGAAAAPSGSPRKQSIDYRAILSPEHFVLYAKLRELRKEIALQEAIPVFAVFTNAQLAQMVKRKVGTKTALQLIDGVGESRAELALSLACAKKVNGLRPRARTALNAAAAGTTTPGTAGRRTVTGTRRTTGTTTWASALP